MPLDLNSWIGYCGENDLLSGVDVRLPAGLSKAGAVRDAADEIDSMIGFLYQTPVHFDDPADAAKYRPTLLILKRINRFLASGRLILATAASGEQSQLHAYGERLVTEALATLNDIVERRVILEGAAPNQDIPNNYQGSQGYIFNLDATSQVEHFYDNILNAPVAGRFHSQRHPDFTGPDGA